jgi:hypothetical protein
MLAGVLLCCVVVAMAQQTNFAPTVVPIDVVPIDKEPMHHLVFENEYVRVFNVEVPPHSETKYHQHDRDYVWVALGESDVESTKVGKDPVHITPKDGEAQFSKGPFAHKAVNRSDKPFRNVTVELKKVGEPSQSGGSTTALGQSLSTNLIISKTLSCDNVRPIQPREGVTVALEPLRNYLVIAAGKGAIDRDSEKETESRKQLSPGAFIWIEKTKDSLYAISAGKSAITICRFE